MATTNQTLECVRCGEEMRSVCDVRTWDTETVMSVNGLVPYTFFHPVCQPCCDGNAPDTVMGLPLVVSSNLPNGEPLRFGPERVEVNVRLRHADDCIGVECNGKSVAGANRACPCQCH